MVLVVAAEIELELILQRTKEALRRKAEGKQLGRPKVSYGVSKLPRAVDRCLISGAGVSKVEVPLLYVLAYIN